MKKQMKLVLLTASLGVTTSVFAAGEIVFVNLDTVFRNYYKTKLAQTQLREEEARDKKEMEGLVAEFQAQKEKYEKLRAESLDDILSAEIRANKRNEAEDALINLQEKAKVLQETEQRFLKQRQAEQVGRNRRLLEQIHDAIKLEAKTQGYRGVVNIQKIGAPAWESVVTVPYCDESAEITSDIIQIINKGSVDEELSEDEIEIVAPEVE